MRKSTSHFLLLAGLAFLTFSTAGVCIAQTAASVSTLQASERAFKDIMDDLEKRGKKALPISLPPLPAEVAKPKFENPLPARMQKNFVSRRGSIVFSFSNTDYAWHSSPGALLPGGKPDEVAQDLTLACRANGQIPAGYQVTARAKDRSFHVAPVTETTRSNVQKWQAYETRQRIASLHQQIEEKVKKLTGS